MSARLNLQMIWTGVFSNPLSHSSCPKKEACRCHMFGMGDCDKYFKLEKSM